MFILFENFPSINQLFYYNVDLLLILLILIFFISYKSLNFINNILLFY